MLKFRFIKLFEATLGIFACGFVLLPTLAPLFFILILIVVVLGFIKKEVSFQFTTLSSLFIFFYLCYLIGLYFTNDVKVGVFELEKKLSFVILPLLLSLKFKKLVSLNFTYIGFIIGTFLVSIYGIIMALKCGIQSNHSLYCYFSSAISPIHHPSYLAAYILFSIVIAFNGLRENIRFFSLNWIIPFTIFGIVLHIFLSSLAGILFLFITLIITLIIWVRKNFNNSFFYSSILIFVILGYFALNSAPSIKDDWKDSTSKTREYFRNPSNFVTSRSYPMSSSEVRIVMWTVACQVISKHPFGVGTGNTDEFLGKELKNLKQQELARHNFNPHNQFLQIAVEIGIFGLLIFCSIIFYGLYYSIKYRNWLLLLIIGNLFFNCLFESMLQRQSGIIFYCFWICLLSSYFFNNRITKISKN